MRVIFLFLILGLIETSLFAQEIERNLSDFNLAGFTQKGKKSWEITGKSADIFTEKVKIHNLTARLYRDEEDIELKAEEADFNKTDGNLNLKKNVVLTTNRGGILTTNTLDWDRGRQIISTKDKVDIQRDNIIASALGAFAQPDLKKINLEKEVLVQINPEESQTKKIDPRQKITISCDGPLEIDYEKNIATFYNNTKVVKEDIQIFSDRLEVYFLKEQRSSVKDATLSGIKMIQASGNVRIIKGDNVSFSQEAIYEPQDKKIILKGSPRLIIFPEQEEFNATSGG